MAVLRPAIPRGSAQRHADGVGAPGGHVPLFYAMPYQAALRCSVSCGRGRYACRQAWKRPTMSCGRISGSRTERLTPGSVESERGLGNMLATFVVRAERLASWGSSSDGAHRRMNAHAFLAVQGRGSSVKDGSTAAERSRMGLPEPGWDSPCKPRLGHLWHGGKRAVIEDMGKHHTCHSTEETDPCLVNLRQQGLYPSGASCSPNQRTCVRVDTIGAYCSLWTQLRSSCQRHCAAIQSSIALACRCACFL